MKKKILLVEDDNLVSTIFKMFLNELGYDLIGVVEEGKEAIKQCEKLHPDIILMDVHLDGILDGIETTEIIKQKFDIPVIFLSSDTEKTTIKRVISTHSYGYLVKPIDKRELGICIELAFYKHRYDMEQKMREKRYRNFITAMPEAIAVVNEQGIIEYLNCLGSRLFRTVYIEDLLGLPLSTFVEESFKEELKAKFDSAFKTNQGLEYTYLKFYTIHKDLIDVRLTGAQVEFNGKKSLQLIIRDVTPDFAYRRMLAEKVDIINKLHDGVISFDLKGNITLWNYACEQIFGWKEKEVLKRSIDELGIFTKGKCFEKTLLKPTLEKGNIRFDLQYLDKSNEEKTLNFSSSMLHNEGEKSSLVCYVKDVTEKVKNKA